MDGKNNQAKARPCRALWDSPYRELTDLAIRIGHMHRTALERRLNRTGVYRSQHQLLMCIAKYPQMSQKQLAKERHVSTATVAVSLKKLENGTFVTCSKQECNITNADRLHTAATRPVMNSLLVVSKKK